MNTFYQHLGALFAVALAILLLITIIAFPVFLFVLVGFVVLGVVYYGAFHLTGEVIAEYEAQREDEE